MYKDIFESIRNEAEKRNLRERTIQLYCSDVSYFLRWSGKNVSDLTLEDAESFLTAKRLEGRSPETHNHYRSAIKLSLIHIFFTYCKFQHSEILLNEIIKDIIA